MIELPSDLAELSAEELIDAAYTARTEFFALHDSDDYSDETLDAMSELVDSLETLQVEADRRVELAVKREALLEKAGAGVELASLPPALAAQIVKKLKADLAAEKDPKKKAEIQAKIDKYEG